MVISTNNSRKSVDIRFKAFVVTAVVGLLLGGVFNFLPQEWVAGHGRDYQESALQPSYAFSETSLSFQGPVDLPTGEVRESMGRQEEQSEVENYISGKLDPKKHQEQAYQRAEKQLFDDAVRLMQVSHYDAALVKWHEFLGQYPNVPEAHSNMGFVLLTLKKFDLAQKAFEQALTLKSQFANAYYGLAVAAEHNADYEFAIGAMRSYLHLRQDDTFAAKARAALWQWEESKNKLNKQ